MMNEIIIDKRIPKLIDAFLDYERLEFARFLESDKQKTILFMQMLKQEELVTEILMFASGYYGEFYIKSGSIHKEKDKFVVDYNRGIFFSNKLSVDNSEEYNKKVFHIFICPHCQSIEIKRILDDNLCSSILKFRHANECLLNNSRLS